jgi:hypothetical protein
MQHKEERMGNRSAAGIVLMSLAALLGAAYADTLSVRLGEQAYIAGPIRGQTKGRLLVAVPVPDQVQQARIDHVQLTIPGVRLTERLLTLEGYAVTTAWEPSRVSWTAPWRNPGGDMASTRASCFFLTVGAERPIALDLTDVVKSWQRGAGAYGVLLKRPNREGGGFGLEGQILRQALAAARVKYYYTRVQQ